MLPSTFAGLAVVVLAVLPGAAFVWSYERQYGAFNAALTDRILRFLGVSAVIQLVAIWPEYVMFRILAPRWPSVPLLQFFLSWLLLFIVVGAPSIVGSIAGWRARSRVDRSLSDFLRYAWRECREHGFSTCILRTREQPTRAWDHFFSSRTPCYLRVRTSNSEWIGGAFADKSYAGGAPDKGDLYIENAFTLRGPHKELDKPTGLALYVPADKIEYIEVDQPGEVE